MAFGVGVDVGVGSGDGNSGCSEGSGPADKPTGGPAIGTVSAPGAAARLDERLSEPPGPAAATPRARTPT